MGVEHRAWLRTACTASKTAIDRLTQIKTLLKYMHYFRHTVRPLMRRAGFSSEVRDKFTGHETRGSIGDTVYDGVLLEELKPAVKAIRYPYLNLPRVWR